MRSPFAPGVALWVTQSLVGAGFVLAWITAARRAREGGVRWPLRWAFPWAQAWRDRRYGLLAAALGLAALYALCAWLARRA